MMQNYHTRFVLRLSLTVSFFGGVQVGNVICEIFFGSYFFILDQKWKIIGKLRDANCLAHVTVKTVDELDGTEFQVVIVSLVRTQEAGILNGSSIILHKKIHCNGLLKVALTRAKSALYIVGNLKAVEKFGGDIGELAKYCKNKELVSDILK